MGSSYNSDDDDVGVCSRSHTHNTTFLERERERERERESKVKVRQLSNCSSNMYSTNPIHYYYIGLAVIIFGGSSALYQQNHPRDFYSEKYCSLFCFLGFSTH